MKRVDLEDFIKENNLLTKNIHNSPGIYAITIDDYIVYIGQSKNVRERCSQHIYNIENAAFIKEKKYFLLLAAKFGGHDIDCIGISYGGEDALLEAEAHFINEYDPCLNINKPKGKNDISDLKIEDVLSKLRWRVQGLCAYEKDN